MPNPTKLTDEQVIEARRAYAAKEATQRQIAKQLGMTQANISRILQGHMYKHLPGGVDKRQPLADVRVLTPEQVLELRRVFKTKRFSVRDLSEYYDLWPTTLYRVITGVHYRDVPEAVKADLKGFRKPDTRVPLAQVMTAEERVKCREAVDRVLAHFGKRRKDGSLSLYGAKRRAGPGLGTTARIVEIWNKIGYITPAHLEKVSEVVGIPIAEIRPDLHRGQRLARPRPSKAEMALMIQMALVDHGYSNGLDTFRSPPKENDSEFELVWGQKALMRASKAA